MGTEVVCGIDLGSTNTKVVALDASGRVRLRSTAPTRRLPGGLVSARELLTGIEEMLARLRADGHLIVAVCAAGVGEDGLLVDVRQQPLCPVLPWFHPDRTRVLQGLVGVLPDHLELPVPTDAARTLIGWRWSRQHPGTDTATSWVALTDWPAASWTGRHFISDTLAARTAAWLPDRRSWLRERVQRTLGKEELLPEVVPAGTVLGRIRSPVLQAAGVLAPDAVAVAGGHDHPIGGWAVQQMDPAAVVDSMGTAEVVVAQSPRPNVGRTALTDVAPAVVGTGTSVLAVQELARNVAWASREPHVKEQLGQLLTGKTAPTEHVHAEVFIPGEAGGGEPAYAADAPTDPLARASALLGALARRGDQLITAVRASLVADPALYATGGWSRSGGWMEIKRTTTGRQLRLVGEPEVTAVAAALLAGHGIGWGIPAHTALAGDRDTPAG